MNWKYDDILASREGGGAVDAAISKTRNRIKIMGSK
jgi:hypothetical protein